MKNSNDTIGNRTRDLPDFRAVPQPSAYHSFGNINKKFSSLLNFEDVLQRRYRITTLRCVISQKIAHFTGNVYIPHAYLRLPQMTLQPIHCEKHRHTTPCGKLTLHLRRANLFSKCLGYNTDRWAGNLHFCE